MMRVAALVLAAAGGCARASAHGDTAGSDAPAAATPETPDASAADSGTPVVAPDASVAAAGTAVAVPPGGSDAAAGTAAATTPPEGSAQIAPWAARLTPLVFRDVNTLANVTLRLYKDDGTFDEDAAAEIDRVVWAPKAADAPPMSRRLLRLVVKAAAHFEAHEVHVISSHRGSARKGSRHRTGQAIDFLFPDVTPKKLAAVLRTFARVGVGEYVHPRSQYVHLDVREQSYHWVDGSPPRRSWKEHALPDPTSLARDAAYAPELDLPDRATAPR